MNRITSWDKVVLTLCIVGALNWLLVGLFQWDLVAALFGGADSWLSRIIYTIIGIAGLFCIRLFTVGRDDREVR